VGVVDGVGVDVNVAVLVGMFVEVGGGVNVLEGICVGVFVKVEVLVFGRKGVLVSVLVGVIVGVFVWVVVGVNVKVLVSTSGVMLEFGVELVSVDVMTIVGVRVGVTRESGAKDSVMKPMQ